MSVLAVKTVGRNQRFDMFRVLFACLVILAHAPELTDGNRNRELWNRWTHSGNTFGTVAVDGFFLLSGFLIVQSWQHNPEILNFLRKRMLRIVPGFVVASVLSVLIIGLLAPGVPHFFRNLGRPFVKSMLVFGVPVTPPLLPGMPYPVANGSFWTLPYEVRCYCLVSVLGICTVVRRPAIWLSVTIGLLLGTAVPEITSQWHWHLRTETLSGTVANDFHLTASFFVGGCFYLFHEWIKFRRLFALAAGGVLLAVRLLSPEHLEVAVIVFGGYLMFYLAQLPTDRFANMRRLPDLSYGIYLYGFPIESLWIWYRHGSPWVTAAVSTVLAAAMGWLSWHYVERPMLRLKRRSTASLPAP